MSNVQSKAIVSDAAADDTDRTSSPIETKEAFSEQQAANGAATEVSEFELLENEVKIIENQVKITHTFLENYKDSKLTDILSKKYKDKRFVLLDIQTPCADPLYETVSWIFTIDKSGSMKWSCKDGKTKMDHLKQTFENMLGYFVDISDKFGIKQTITVLTFNDNTNVLCKDVPITAEFVKIFKETMDENFTPSGGTDIFKALALVNEHVRSHPILSSPTSTSATFDQQIDKSLIIHIFMSDGEVTSGIQNKQHIQSQVVIDHRVYNSFIGFGEDHDSELMKILASGSWSDYFYVKDFEQSSTVYAETIYNGLYQYIKNVKVTIDDESARIYNFEKNTWGDSFTVDSIQSGSTKNFHITVSNYDPSINIKVEYDLSGKRYTNNSKLKKESIDKIDIEAYKYLWRQETLELLFDIENYHNNNSHHQMRGNNLYYMDVDDVDVNFDREFPKMDDVYSDDDNNYADDTAQDKDDNKDKEDTDTDTADDKDRVESYSKMLEDALTFDINKNDELSPTPRKNRCCFGFSMFNYTQYEYSNDEETPPNDDEEKPKPKEDKKKKKEQKTSIIEKEKDKKKNKKKEKDPSKLDKINARINTYFEELQSFIKNYNLADDEFMKQLGAMITSSQKTLLNNNQRNRSDNYSRRQTLGRQRSHSINESNYDCVDQSTAISCFRNGTLDNIIQRVSADSTQNK